MKPGERQRVRSVLTTEGQQGGTNERDQGDDCTEAGRVVIGFTIIGKDGRGYAGELSACCQVCTRTKSDLLPLV